MHLVILLAAVSIVNGDHNNSYISCDGLIFNDYYFDKEAIVKNIGRPYNLFYHTLSKCLFFSHTTHNGTYLDFKITACEVDTKKCHDVGGIPGGYAIAYDLSNDEIYLGGHDGIYRYNFLTKSAESYAEVGKSIWGLFFGKKFFYIRYPSQKLYMRVNNRFVLVAEAQRTEIDYFYISKIGDLYFSNKTALYKIEPPISKIFVLSNQITVRQIVEDRFGDIFFCASDGIYKEGPYRTLRKIATIYDAYGMAIDESYRVIYSDKDAIYRLNPSQYDDECYSLLRKRNDNDEMSEFKKVTIKFNL